MSENDPVKLANTEFDQQYAETIEASVRVGKMTREQADKLLAAEKKTDDQTGRLIAIQDTAGGPAVHACGCASKGLECFNDELSVMRLREGFFCERDRVINGPRSRVCPRHPIDTMQDRNDNRHCPKCDWTSPSPSEERRQEALARAQFGETPITERQLEAANERIADLKEQCCSHRKPDGRPKCFTGDSCSCEGTVFRSNAETGVVTFLVATTTQPTEWPERVTDEQAAMITPTGQAALDDLPTALRDAGFPEAADQVAALVKLLIERSEPPKIAGTNVDLVTAALSPIDFAIAAAERQMLSLGVPVEILIRWAMQHAASLCAVVKTPLMRAELMKQAIGNFPTQVRNAVTTSRTTTGGIIRPGGD